MFSEGLFGRPVLSASNPNTQTHWIQCWNISSKIPFFLFRFRSVVCISALRIDHIQSFSFWKPNCVYRFSVSICVHFTIVAFIVIIIYIPIRFCVVVLLIDALWRHFVSGI